MAIASMLTFMANWSTPTVLFCVLNLMIATIFIASNYKSPNHNPPSQLTRSPSLLERVKSVNLSSFYTTPEPTEYNSTSQLSRTPSLLQRVKSIDFSFGSFYNSIPTESEQLGNSRTVSLVDRVKSVKLTFDFDSDQHSGNTPSSKDEYSDIDPHHDSVLQDTNVTSGNSSHLTKLANSSEKSGVTPATGSPSKLTKSGSKKKAAAAEGGEEVDDRQRRLPATKRAARVHDESVDAKADDFIKRFKQQLKLQRLNSLQRLREMLNRGT